MKKKKKNISKKEISIRDDYAKTFHDALLRYFRGHRVLKITPRQGKPDLVRQFYFTDEYVTL